MGNKIYLNGRFGFREDTLENWMINNPILERGEPSIVRDGQNGEWLKIGDGVTRWKELPYKLGPKGDKGDTGEKGTDGKDGKDVTVDQNYTPLSENAQSGLAVAEAVSGKADIPKEYELIETITLEEEVASVVKTKEPDGTAYNFKKMVVYIQCPKNTETIPLQISSASYYIGNINYAISKDWNSVSIVELNCDEQLQKVRATLYNLTNSFTNSPYVYSDRILKSSSVPINYLKFYVENEKTLPVGMKFEIWGVRA